MNTEIILALVVSITSLLVALAGYVSAIINKKQTHHSLKEMEGQTHQSQKEIEALKYQLTRSKKSAKIRDDLWSKSVDSLSEGIRCIQKFKDTVQFIVSAEGTSLDADLAMEYITEARSEFFFF